MERGAPLQQGQQAVPATIAQPIPHQPPRVSTTVVSILFINEILYLLINKIVCFEY
jgi:hypothetical protein